MLHASHVDRQTKRMFLRPLLRRVNRTNFHMLSADFMFTQVRMTSMISAASRSRVMQQRFCGSRRMHRTIPVYWIGRIWSALEGQHIKGAGAGLTSGCRNVNRFVLLSRSPTIDNHS